jgi:putative FmdB family regulatory protein
MPLYEYQCNKCDKEFIMSADKPPKTNPTCPNCGSENTMRLWNAPTVIFRGNGFYTTDNKEKKDDT